MRLVDVGKKITQRHSEGEGPHFYTILFSLTSHHIVIEDDGILTLGYPLGLLEYISMN